MGPERKLTDTAAKYAPCPETDTTGNGEMFDCAAFKAVMRKLAGTVCVISTTSDQGYHGLAATAVCSISVEPPRVLAVVNRSSRTHSHIIRRKAFTISILAEGQQHVAELFGSTSPNRFQDVGHSCAEGECPVIDASAAFLSCTIETQVEVGTHTIFIGRVSNGSAGREQPLVYYDAKYCRLSAMPKAEHRSSSYPST